MKILERCLVTAGCVLVAAALIVLIFNVSDADRAARASQITLHRLEKRIKPQAESEKNITITLDGNQYIGVLDIPSVDIKLPVMNDWSDKKLKISPCRYSGSYENDDLVICGHNYARHFSPLKHIANGAEVIFTTAAGEQIRYRVTDKDNVQPSDIDTMINKNANWDLTLFTCNTGGMTRCAVRCERIR